MKIKPLKFIASSLDDLRNFQKKTKKTSKQEIDLARQRYKQIGG